MATTVSLGALAVGGVAANQGHVSTQLPIPNEGATSAGPVTAESTAVKASFAKGCGANRLSVKVSTHGNLLSFESPAGQEAVFDGSEGYVVCTGGGATVHGHDTGSVESGFGPPTFSQPNAGAFPLCPYTTGGVTNELE